MDRGLKSQERKWHEIGREGSVRDQGFQIPLQRPEGCRLLLCVVPGGVV